MFSYVSATQRHSDDLHCSISLQKNTFKYLWLRGSKHVVNKTGFYAARAETDEEVLRLKEVRWGALPERSSGMDAAANTGVAHPTVPPVFAKYEILYSIGSSANTSLELLEAGCSETPAVLFACHSPDSWS